MSLPAGLTTITVTGTYDDALGDAGAGSVMFTPTATVIDPAGKVILTQIPVVAALSGGTFTLGPLPCTDNPGLTPLGWAYSVTVAVAGAQQTFTTLLPHALGATVDISQLTPVTGSPAPAGSFYLPNATTVPTSAPSLGGGFLYAEEGNLLWLGTGGTPETIAPSEGALPLTSLGDMVYQGPSGPARLPGNTATGKNFLTQTGAGAGVSAGPQWGAIAATDLPAASGGTAGAVQLAGDLGGTAASPHVVGTHLTAPLPVAQGGTGSASATSALSTLGGAALAGAAFTGYVDPAVVTLTDAATVTVDASAGNDFRVTLNGSRTMGNPSSPGDGQKILFQVTQGSGGNFTLTWGSAYEFSTSLPQPTLSTAAGSTDLIGFIYNAAKAKWLFVAAVTGFA